MDNKSFRIVIVFIIVIVAFGLLGASEPNILMDASDLKQRAIQSISSAHSIPLEHLKVVKSAKVTYASQGVDAHKFKVMDARDGTIYLVTLTSSGREFDGEQVFSAEQTAYAEKYGRVDSILAQWMQNAPEAEKISVVIWMKNLSPEMASSRPDPDAKLSQEEMNAFNAEQTASLEQLAQSLTTGMVTELRQMGVEASASSGVPVVYADLSASQIRDLSRRPEVDTIYFAPISTPDLDTARFTIRANVPQSAGINGDGVQAAQIEVGGRVATSNPYLSGVVQDPMFVCASPDPHGTGVAGIIRSTNATFRGIAPGVTLRAGGSCTGLTAQLQSRANAARTWGAKVINLSFGANMGRTPGADDRFYDYFSINYGLSIVKSAGNEAGPCGSGSGNVTSPGLGYNTITVGNLDDLDTTAWGDDVMDNCSSFVDPTSQNNDREKPEVAAPGSFIVSTTNSSPFVGLIGSGTSFAAPMVTGVVAQMMERNPALMTEPEAVKAILIASATHNIEGSSRLSDKDGSGGINANLADVAARRSTAGVPKRGNWGNRTYSCTSPIELVVGTMNLQAGRNLRLAIAWDQNPDYASYSLRPSADLDLVVLNSAGTVVAVSASFDNTYEVVQFTPSVAGAYKIGVFKERCDLTPKFLGWSWIQQ